MVITAPAPARAGSGGHAPPGAAQGSPWFLLAAVVLLLIGTAGLLHANTAGRASSAEPGRPSSTAPVPEPWGDDVLAAAELSGLPAPVVAAQLDVESRWDPRAVSPAGARGLAQFVPRTWQRYGRGDPFDPERAIRAQGAYLKDLRRMVRVLEPASAEEETVLVLAAYNAGPTVVLAYGGVPPYAETRDYVARIQELAATRYAGVCACR